MWSWISFCLFIGIVLTAYSPLGSPDRPASNKEAEPVVLNNPVLQKIADKHNTTIALVSCLHKSVYILLYFFCLQLVSMYPLDWQYSHPGAGEGVDEGQVLVCACLTRWFSTVFFFDNEPHLHPPPILITTTFLPPGIARWTCVFFLANVLRVFKLPLH